VEPLAEAVLSSQPQTATPPCPPQPGNHGKMLNHHPANASNAHLASSSEEHSEFAASGAEETDDVVEEVRQRPFGRRSAAQEGEEAIVQSKRRIRRWQKSRKRKRDEDAEDDQSGGRDEGKGKVQSRGDYRTGSYYWTRWVHMIQFALNEESETFHMNQSRLGKYPRIRSTFWRS
jgi:hypothetical protein